MNGKIFVLLFALILIISTLVRFIPPQGNNFYFTTDQGYDAVHVREILENHKILLKGPETGIKGVFHGPVWYYFIGVGYFLFGGHPFGGVFIVILLNLATTAFLMLYLAKKVSPWVGIGMGLALQIFWPYYDFSRYAFNPFPSAYLSIFLIIFLIEFLEGKKRSYYWSLLPIFFAANGEIVAAAVFLGFYFFVGIYGVYKQILPLRQFIVLNVILPGIGVIPLFNALYRQFAQSSLSSQDVESARGYFSGFSFGDLLLPFSEIFQRSIIPQNLALSLIFVFLVCCLVWKKKKSLFALRFAVLTLGLWFTSYLFFSTNRAWMEWHTYYLYLLAFISIVLLVFSLPKKLMVPLLAIIISCQLSIFSSRYQEYLKPTEDPGLLVNQIKVVDWIYQNSEHDGFSAFTYSPTGFDYPYQYLYWWYGKKTYDYIPCEYSNAAPGIWKLYMPSPLGFNTQILDCNKFRFLVFEPGKIQKKQVAWIEKAQEKTILLEEKTIGQVKIEKRRLKRQEEK